MTCRADYPDSKISKNVKPMFRHALANALFASALIFAACARSSSVTSLKLRDWISAEGREDSAVDAFEESADDDADDESLIG